MNISEIELCVNKYRKIVILTDEVVCKWFKVCKKDKFVGDDILILFEENNEDIKRLYTLYEFTDKIIVISATESRFVGLWNLYNTKIINSNELLKLVING